MNDFLTREKTISILKELGIRNGSNVCLQMDISKFTNVIGGIPMIIEVLKEIVGENGCIFMPSFSYSCLDPACFDSNTYEYDFWKHIRKSIRGYDGINSDCDIYKDTSNVFLHSMGVVRSNHPVYSFALWGNFDERLLKQEINEPLSFQSPLRLLTSENAYNVLIGIEPSDALLLQAMGHRLQIGQTIVQRAFINSKKNQTKSFLVTKTNEFLCQDLLDVCFLQQYDIEQNSIYALSLENN